MNNTRKLQGFLEENGFWAEMVADSGAKDGYSLCLNVDKEHFFSIYLNENDLFVVRVDGSGYTVDCATKETVLDVIKMAIFCLENQKLKYTCCICGKEFVGYGNNPQPVKDKGRCCDACNAEVVIPARLGIMIKKEKVV